MNEQEKLAEIGKTLFNANIAVFKHPDGRVIGICRGGIRSMVEEEYQNGTSKGVFFMDTDESLLACVLADCEFSHIQNVGGAQ